MGRAEARAHWRQHIDACAASGLLQTQYCAQHGLKSKYMTYWKRRLRSEAQAVDDPKPKSKPRKRVARPKIALPALVPVVIQDTRRPSPPPPTEMPCNEEQVIARIKLPNGIGITLEMSSTAWPRVLTELAQLPC